MGTIWTDIHCALGLSQFAKLDRFVSRRRQLIERYRRLLAPLAPVVRMPSTPTDGGAAWHLCLVLVDFAAADTTRARVMNALKAQGIGSQVHYIPVHRQPYYEERYGAMTLPGADAYYRRCLSLPLFPAMSDADVDRVVTALSQVLGR